MHPSSAWICCHLKIKSSFIQQLNAVEPFPGTHPNLDRQLSSPLAEMSEPGPGQLKGALWIFAGESFLPESVLVPVFLLATEGPKHESLLRVDMEKRNKNFGEVYGV